MKQLLKHAPTVRPLHRPAHARRWLGATFALAMTSTTVQAAAMPLECAASSPDNRVALVELYTSQGCSSCPPADRWLSALTKSGLGSDKVLPLSLHVDYWDYIGWKDPFAMPRFTDRQRDGAVRNRLRSIYTPQVVLDGDDWRRWWEAGPFLERVSRINQQPAPVRLRISGSWQPGLAGTAVVTTTAEPVASVKANDIAGGRLHLAVTESGLQTKVSRGENAGESLRHDSVVRVWLDPVRVKNGSASFDSQQIPLPAGVNPENMGLAAFVQNASGEVTQAVSCRFVPTS